MGRPTDPIPSVTLQVLREISARRDSRPEIAVPTPGEDCEEREEHAGSEPPTLRDGPATDEPPR